MRVLMVSPFPPLRDGIGKYAAQEVQALRREGHHVDVLSPVGCAAHYVEDLRSGRRMLKLVRYARRYDRVVLQYQPSHYHTRGSGRARIMSNLCMCIAFRFMPNLSVVCHEVEYPPSSWPRWRPEVLLERAAWKAAPEVVFHTQREVDEMQVRLGIRPRRTTLREHGRFFRPAVAEDRRTARRRLHVDEDGMLFVCIGFIQPHKGFDRAIAAFRSLPGDDLRLIVVGSIRTESPEHRGYLRDLERAAAGDARVEVREAVLSDEEFDRWILASDAVVLPYREIWSSGVVERAKTLGRSAIVTSVGGLREQAGPDDVVVADDRDLVEAMARFAGRRPEPPRMATAAEAQRHVRMEAGRARDASTTQEGDSVTSAINRVHRSRGVHPVILPSSRPVVGPALTTAKRYLQRAIGWYIVPMLGQINVFEEMTAQALAALGREIELLRPHMAALQHTAGAHKQSLVQLRDALERLEASAEQLDEAMKRLGQLERRTRGLMELAGSGAAGDAAVGGERAASSGVGDYTALNYHLFEAQFRGDPVLIKERQREAYLKDFLAAGPVLDVGCGRGEFLEVLSEAGVDARGVDLDLDMVMDCRSKGLDVEHADAIEYLSDAQAESLGGIFAAQFIEHLAPRGIVEFLAAARRALRPDGIAIIETINPQSLFALANWYFMDLTHAQPVHPMTLRFLAEQEGFRDIEIRYRAPVREEPPTVELSDDAPAWAKSMATSVASELQRIDEVVFGPQDYAIVLRTPA